MPPASVFGLRKALSDSVGEAVVNVNFAVTHVPRIADDPLACLRTENSLEHDRVIGLSEVVETFNIDRSLPVNVSAEKFFQSLIPPHDVRRGNRQNVEWRDQHRILGVLIVYHLIYLVGIDIRHVLVEELSAWCLTHSFLLSGSACNGALESAPGEYLY